MIRIQKKNGMKRNKLALSCLLMVTGFFGACTDMAEDDFQNNKYPVELMAEKDLYPCYRRKDLLEWWGGNISL